MADPLPSKALSSAQTEAVFTTLLARSTPDYLLSQPAPDRAVFEDEDFRWYCHPAGAVQGAMALNAPQTLLLPNQQAMALALTLVEKPAQALDLGTGCGGVLRMLSGTAGLHLRSVEHDAAMLDLAQRFFELPRNADLLVADVWRFLAEDGNAYDLIFCDVFDGVREPPWLASEDFYAALRAHLAPRGAIALNLLPDSEEQLRGHLRAASKYFGGIGVRQFDVLGNIVLLLREDPLPADEAWIAALERALPEQAGAVGSWLGGVVRMPVA